MRKLERHRDGREMDERDLEMRERVAGLQPRPERNGGDPRDGEDGSKTGAEIQMKLGIETAFNLSLKQNFLCRKLPRDYLGLQQSAAHIDWNQRDAL
jgi:hypothetical protein